MKLRHFIMPALLAMVALGCDAVGEAGETPTPAENNVFVINQGNFGDGNGSVTAVTSGLNPTRRGTISGLGSILQSAALIDGKLYLMANSANRIDVFDATSLEQEAQIDSVISPRYMVAENRTAYVTNFFESTDSFMGGKVTVIDLVDNERVLEIPVGNNPEGLAIVDQRLYVANHGFGEGSTVSVIDLSTNVVTDTIDVDCDGPRFVIADDDEDVFVFCTGKTAYDDQGTVIGETDAAVRVLDGRTGDVIKRIAIDGRIGTEGPGQDAFHAAGVDRIFAVKDQSSILVFDTATNDRIAEIGPFDGEAISAVAFDEQNEHLYLGRSGGFVAAGSVTIHTDDGAEVGEATAGIVPTYIILAE